MNLRLFSIVFLSFIYCSLIIGQESKTTEGPELPVDEKSGLITYKEVVTEDGTKEEFFNHAVVWINSYYKNPAGVTKVRDLETGEIKGVARFKIKNTDKNGFETDAGVIQYNFTLEFKEGRYRYILTGFFLKQASKIPVEKWMDKENQQYTPVWDDYLLQINKFAEDWIASLKEGMKPKVENTDDDW
ncbi:MAG: DUF4468 domain-containing protein [Bacteroidales bacterium]|nr:DUF4468 domain-containing protein [Bacteroidales bacterium]